MESDTVIAVASAVQALALIAALVFAGWQLRDGMTARREQSRAYVVTYFDEDPELHGLPYLVVKNFGQTAAYDIALAFDPPLRSSDDGAAGYSLAKVGFIDSGIPMLAPGTDVRTQFDSMITRPRDWETRYQATVTYKDRHRKSHSERFVLDLSAKRNTTYIGEKGLRKINDHLENLVKAVRHVRGSTDD